VRPDRERVLYRGGSAGGPDILITTGHLTFNGVRYRLDELSEFGTVRGRRPVGRRHTRITGLVAVVAVLVVVFVAIGTGWTRQIWLALAAALIVTVAASFLPTLLGAALRRPYELWARYRDAPLLLFVTEDSEQYGQVIRAVVRAREWREEHSS
jgi:hypothetical protein